MKILVIGSGTAGLISSLILKKTFPTSQINVMYSKKHDIIGVGEGSTEHWRQFMDYVGITNEELIKECDATYKSGIFFKDWSIKPYLHAIEGNYTQKYLERLFSYENLIANSVDPIDLTLPIASKSKVKFDNDIKNTPPVAQYHFDTFKLNSFLIKKCKQSGIAFVEDTIKIINKNEQGFVSSVEGNRKHESDFYIDCTGFKRIISNTYHANWKSFEEHLQVNTAITFPTKGEQNIPMYTTAQAMNAGWMFRIPTYERFGNGYIFDNTEISLDQAHQEIEQYFKEEIDIKKHIEFSPGYLSNPWQKNTLAIGLSSNFVEPLEATSLGITIQQAFLLASHLGSYNERTIEMYNSIFENIMLNVRDFVFLHYLNKNVSDKKTPFWHKVQNIQPSEKLKQIIGISQCRLPIDSDINYTNYELFSSANFSLVLYSLRLLNQTKIKEHYYNLPQEVRQYAEANVLEIQESLKKDSFVNHKTALDIIRQI